jgi:hypothetical protein
MSITKLFRTYRYMNRPFMTFRNKIIFTVRSCPMPHPKAGPPLVGCPCLLIQYIRSYPPYLDVISICNLRTYHAMVIRDPPMHRAGSFMAVAKEISKYKLDFMGVQEVR